MSRSGYVDDCDDYLALGRYRGQVNSAIRGRRGQAFLREMADAMDAMPVKELIAGELVTEHGDVCAIGSVCVKRGLDVTGVDVTDPESVANLVGVAKQLAAEIEYVNDECGERYEKTPEGPWHPIDETPEERWQRVRKWIASMTMD